MRISIHVLREEDDFVDKAGRRWGMAISIHVLREEDDLLSRPQRVSRPNKISIHVLREEDDSTMVGSVA